MINIPVVKIWKFRLNKDVCTTVLFHLNERVSPSYPPVAVASGACRKIRAFTGKCRHPETIIVIALKSIHKNLIYTSIPVMSFRNMPNNGSKQKQQFNKGENMSKEKEINSLYDLFTYYCNEINEFTGHDFNVTYSGSNDYDGYFRIFDGDKLLTEGDYYDIEQRLKQILRENGLLSEVNIVDVESFG